MRKRKGDRQTDRQTETKTEGDRNKERETETDEKRMNVRASVLVGGGATGDRRWKWAFIALRETLY